MVFLAVFVFFVLLSGLFAGCETGVYQLSRVRLRLGIERKRFSYVVLGKVMHDSAGLVLSTLVGTNLAHYAATSTVTYFFFTNVDAGTAEMLAVFVAAPVLFVFSEMIPKNIFFYRADFLMPYVAPVLFVFHKIFTWCGVVPLLRLLSDIFSRFAGLASSSKAVITSTQRHRVRAILQDIREEGILSSVQADIVERIVGIPGISIRSVMVPMSRVEAVDVNSDKAALLKKLEGSAFTRLAVYEGEAANIIGFVDMYEALSWPEEFADLRIFLKPIGRLDGDMPVTDAIHVMQSEKHKIVLVTRSGRGGRALHIGIVTMKDLAEELLGELAEW